MSEPERPDTGFVEIGLAARTLPGEAESGDVELVKPLAGGVLLAAIDGLGHGAEAAHAAELARATLDEAPADDLAELFQRCHERLARTRGVVMSLASFGFDRDVLTWLGVGNVEGTLLRTYEEEERAPPSESILLLGGVVGYQLPALRPSTTSVTAGDTLVLATDGVSSGFAGGLDRFTLPQEIADRVLDAHAKDTDDALVLVARYLGGGR